MRLACSPLLAQALFEVGELESARSMAERVLAERPTNRRASAVLAEIERSGEQPG